MSRPKKTAPQKTVDAYIAGFPQDVRARLETLRAAIRKVAPQAEEAVKYGIPTFVLGENLVHFAAWKTHIGFYPTPSAIAAFAEELSAYSLSKGAVRLPLGGPLPIALIRRIVSFRVREARTRRP